MTLEDKVYTLESRIAIIERTHALHGVQIQNIMDKLDAIEQKQDKNVDRFLEKLEIINQSIHEMKIDGAKNTWFISGAGKFTWALVAAIIGLVTYIIRNSVGIGH